MTEKPTGAAQAQDEPAATASAAGEAKPGEADAQGDPSLPLVFISHRHDDRNIASAIASWITTATLKKVEVFQSSDGLRGVDTGRRITEAISQKVAAADVMIVVYTDQEEDWAWVMFEIGIAMDPATPQTKVVVLQCGDEFPGVLSGFDRIQVAQEAEQTRQADLNRLAKDFLTTKFFPNHPGVVLAVYGEDFVREQAANLWSKLDEFLPPPPSISDPRNR